MLRLLFVMGIVLATPLTTFSLPAEDTEVAQDQEGLPEVEALRRRPPWRPRPTFHIERTTVQRPEAPLSADIYTSALNTIQREKLPLEGPVRLLPHSTLLTDYVSKEASSAEEEEPAPQGPMPGRSPERRPLPQAPVQDRPLPQRPLATSPPAHRPLPQRPLADSPLAQRPLPKRPMPHRPPSEQKPLAERPVAARRPVARPAGDSEQLAEGTFGFSSLFRDRVRRPLARRRRPVQPVRGRARQPNKRPKVRVQALAPRHKPGPKPRRPQLPPPKPYRPALPPSKPARRPPPPPPPASSPPRPPSPTLPPTAATTPSTTTQDPLSVHNLAGPPYFDTIPPEVLLMDETVTVPSLSSTTSVTTTTVPPYIADWRPVSTSRPRLTETTYSTDASFDGRPPHGQGRDEEKDLHDPHVGSHWHEGSQRDVESHRDLSTHRQEDSRKDKHPKQDTHREKDVDDSHWNKGIGWEIMGDLDWYNEWTKNWNNDWNIDWSNRWFTDPPLKDTDAPLNTLPTDPPKDFAGTSSPRPTFTPTKPPSTFAPSNPPQRFAPTDVPQRFTPTDQPQTNIPKRNDGFQRHPDEPWRDTRYQGHSPGNRRYHEVPPRSPSNHNTPSGNRNYQETPQRGINHQFSSPGVRVPQEIPRRDTGYQANLPGNREYQETPQRGTVYPSSPSGNRPPKDIPQRITSYQHVSQGTRRHPEPPHRGRRPNPQGPSQVPTRHNGHQGIPPGRPEENARRTFHRPSQRRQGSSEHPAQTRPSVVGPPRPPPPGTVSGAAKIRPVYTPRRPQAPGTAPRLPPMVHGSSRLGRPMPQQPAAASVPGPAWRPRRRIIHI